MVNKVDGGAATFDGKKVKVKEDTGERNGEWEV